MMVEQVAIFGDGQMGTVCAVMLADRGVHVRLWGRSHEHVETLRIRRENQRHLPGLRIPDRVSFTDEAALAFHGAELVIAAVPCQFLRSIFTQVAPACPPGIPVVSVTKGIENETLLRPTQILSDILGVTRVAALSGPNIAQELAHCLPATMVAASEDDDLAASVQEIFSSQWLRVYTNSDRARNRPERTDRCRGRRPPDREGDA